MLARGAQCYLRASKRLVGCSLWEGRDGATTESRLTDDAAGVGAAGLGTSSSHGGGTGGDDPGVAPSQAAVSTAVRWRLDLSEGPERIRRRLTRYPEFDMVYGFSEYAPPPLPTALLLSPRASSVDVLGEPAGPSLNDAAAAGVTDGGVAAMERATGSSSAVGELGEGALGGEAGPEEIQSDEESEDDDEADKRGGGGDEVGAEEDEGEIKRLVQLTQKSQMLGRGTLGSDDLSDEDEDPDVPEGKVGQEGEPEGGSQRASEGVPGRVGKDKADDDMGDAPHEAGGGARRSRSSSVDRDRSMSLQSDDSNLGEVLMAEAADDLRRAEEVRLRREADLQLQIKVEEQRARDLREAADRASEQSNAAKVREQRRQAEEKERVALEQRQQLQENDRQQKGQAVARDQSGDTRKVGSRWGLRQSGMQGMQGVGGDSSIQGAGSGAKWEERITGGAETAVLKGLIDPCDWPPKRCYNTEQYIGLETKAALLVVGHRSLYVVDGFSVPPHATSVELGAHCSDPGSDLLDGGSLGFGSRFDVRLMGMNDVSARARRNSRRKSQIDKSAAAGGSAPTSPGRGGGSDPQRDAHRWSGGGGDGPRAVTDEEVLGGLWRDACLRLPFDAIHAVYKRRCKLRECGLEFFDVAGCTTLLG